MAASALLSFLPSVLSFASQQNNNNASINRTHEGVQNAINTLQGAQGYADALFNMNNNTIGSWQKQIGDIYGNVQGARESRNNAIGVLNGVKPYEAGSFNYNKNIGDFYDPAYQLSVNAANDAINSSQALGGNLFSSATANRLAAKNNVLATNMFNDAVNAMNADKSMEQNIWQGNELAKQVAANSAMDRAKALYEMNNDSVTNLGNATTDAYKAQLSNNEALYGNRGDYLAALAELEASDPGRVSAQEAAMSALDPTGSFASLYKAGGIGKTLKNAGLGIIASGGNPFGVISSLFV